MGRSCNHCTCEMAVLKFIGMFVRSNDRKKGRLMHNPQIKRFSSRRKSHYANRQLRQLFRQVTSQKSVGAVWTLGARLSNQQVPHQFDHGGQRVDFSLVSLEYLCSWVLVIVEPRIVRLLAHVVDGRKIPAGTEDRLM